MLNWHTEENPCELCGVPVTPEAWAGGITSVQGEWLTPEWVGDPDCCSHPDCGIAAMPCTPIFPPRGFGNMSDAELWHGIHGGYLNDPQPWEILAIPESASKNGVWVAHDGSIILRWLTLISSPMRVDDSPQLILALQNAQVLQRRLQPHAV